jgi:CHAT domain-containing protein
MKTLVIKIDHLSPDATGAKVYPVQLFFDDGDPAWLTKPVGPTTSIPENLSIPNPVIDPILKQPIEGEQIRNLFLTEADPRERLEAWGTYLHQLLFQDSRADEWKRLHGLYSKKVAGKSEGLRTILDIKPDELRWLPWELIYQPTVPLFFDAIHPFSRGTLEKGLLSRSFMWPIRILVVVGSEPDDPKVSAELELKEMQYAFIKSPVPVEWHVSLRPTRQELSDLIYTYKPQIFHFIGHGKEINNYSYLELNNKNGKEEWTVTDVAISLQTWQPRLAFINACRSSSAAAQENSWDIARSFTNADVPAVIGMQADIQGEAAAGFSRKFYHSLFDGLPVDRALAEARAQVSRLPGFTLRNRDWALATLYVQQLPEHILDMTPPIDEKTYQKFKTDGQLMKANDFVGRFKQRRELWHGVDEIEDYEDEFKGACIVVGNARMGKTSLLQASMKVCALRNRRICYVDLGDDTTKDFLAIVKLIRDGDEKSKSVLCKALPPEPFEEFDKEYAHRLAEPNATTNIAGDENLCDQFFNAYKDALIEIAAAAPLILVLDHLNVEWKTFNSVLVERLLLPIARGELPNCRLVMACSVEDFDNRLSRNLINVAHRVNLAKWTADRYAPLMRQICLYNGIELDAEVEGAIKAWSLLVKSEWEPTELRDLLTPLKRARGILT